MGTPRRMPAVLHRLDLAAWLMAAFVDGGTVAVPPRGLVPWHLCGRPHQVSQTARIADASKAGQPSITGRYDGRRAPITHGMRRALNFMPRLFQWTQSRLTLRVSLGSRCTASPLALRTHAAREPAAHLPRAPPDPPSRTNRPASSRNLAVQLAGPSAQLGRERELFRHMPRTRPQLWAASREGVYLPGGASAGFVGSRVRCVPDSLDLPVEYEKILCY
jgi:hypothetical protein